MRSRNWNGAIPIPQVYLNLGSALCRLDPSPSFSLALRRRLLLHFSAIAPARVCPSLGLRPFGMVVIFGEKGDDRPTDRPTDQPTTAVVLGEISNLYSAHQSDSSCWQWHERKKARFREDDTDRLKRKPNLVVAFEAKGSKGFLMRAI